MAVFVDDCIVRTRKRLNWLFHNSQLPLKYLVYVKRWRNWQKVITSLFLLFFTVKLWFLGDKDYYYTLPYYINWINYFSPFLWICWIIRTQNLQLVKRFSNALFLNFWTCIAQWSKITNVDIKFWLSFFIPLKRFFHI